MQNHCAPATSARARAPGCLVRNTITLSLAADTTQRVRHLRRRHHHPADERVGHDSARSAHYPTTTCVCVCAIVLWAPFAPCAPCAGVPLNGRLSVYVHTHTQVACGRSIVRGAASAHTDIAPADTKHMYFGRGGSRCGRLSGRFGTLRSRWRLDCAQRLVMEF